MKTLLLFISVLYSCQLVAQDSLSTPNWSFGAEKGYVLIQGDVDGGKGFGFGFFAQKHLHPLFSARLQVGMGQVEGLEETPRNDWGGQAVWNGTLDSNIDYDNATTNDIYANYKMMYQKASLQGVFHLTQFAFFNNQSAFDGFLLAGIGGMRFETMVDALDAEGQIYDFTKVTALENQTEGQTLANLSAVVDSDFETMVTSSAEWTPQYQVGAGIQWQVKDQLALSLSHRVAWSGTDQLDGYTLSGSNDLQHFTCLGVHYTLFKAPPPPRVKVPILFSIPDIPSESLAIIFELPTLNAIEIPLPPKEEKVELSEEEATVVRRAFDNLEFETSKAVIRDASFSALDELAMLLANHPNWKLKIEGHTDAVGDAEDNLVLSQQRAEAVRDYLMGRGIAGERFSVAWFGETQPIADNETQTGRQKNRRVEMEIVE